LSNFAACVDVAEALLSQTAAPPLRARCHLIIGNCHAERDRIPAANHHFDEAIKEGRASPSLAIVFLSAMQGKAAILRREASRRKEALPLLEEALLCARKAGLQGVEVEVLGALDELYQRCGLDAKAEEVHRVWVSVHEVFNLEVSGSDSCDSPYGADELAGGGVAGEDDEGDVVGVVLKKKRKATGRDSRRRRPPPSPAVEAAESNEQEDPPPAPKAESVSASSQPKPPPPSGNPSGIAPAVAEGGSLLRVRCRMEGGVRFLVPCAPQSLVSDLIKAVVTRIKRMKGQATCGWR
jgi:tetratricopeptide (TPR) repeat protein